MERIRYRIRLARFREQESLHQLMEEQYQKILQDRENAILKTFHVSASDLSAPYMDQEGIL